MAGSFSIGGSQKKNKSKTTTTVNSQRNVNEQQTQTGAQTTTGTQQQTSLSKNLQTQQGSASQQQLSNTLQQQQASGSQQQQQTGAQKATQTTSLLNDQTINDITNLISGLATGVTVAGTNTQALLTSITDKALNSGQDFQAISDAIVKNAEIQGQQKLDLQGNLLAQQAGSSLNSFVQGSQAQGQADLQTQLASLAGQLALQNRQLTTQDLTAAIGGNANAATPVAQLASVLKGGQATTTSDVSNVQTVLQDFLNTQQAQGQQASAGQTQQSQTQQQINQAQAITQTQQQIDSLTKSIRDLTDLFNSTTVAKTKSKGTAFGGSFKGGK